MPHIRSIVRTGFISIAALMLVGNLPLLTFADDSSDNSSTTSTTKCTPPTNTTSPGVHVPIGADASTFTYQCTGQYAGEWTNQYYVYDPVTNTRTPLYPLNYGYDCATGIWTMDSWDYDAATQSYVDDRVQTTAPANAVTNCPVATPASTDSSASSDSAATNTANDSTNGDAADTSSNSGPTDSTTTGPGSTNTVTTTANGITYVNNGTTAIAANSINGAATSGNSLVLGNTSAGDATTGDVQDEADIINMLQSSSDALGSGTNVVTFTDNIDGNVDGNLLLDPSLIAQPAGTTTDTSATNDGVVVNNSTGEVINNTIDLDADSGNADVADNTSGGNATSGSAQAIANIVNMMNSIVTAGNSFIGTININGNLDGNILIPANFVNELLADNVPTVNITAPDSTSTTTTTNSANTTVTNTNNEGINNNVNSTATSGQATVNDNTNGGDATSGSATTNLTAFNLTGSTVVGANDLLVFVNVMGTWVGMIMNAPPGTTAAELGGGITSDTTNTANTTVDNTANEQINNNITANAQSGNANVSRNTDGGNATTGTANTAVNLTNIEGSDLSLSNWFGILFINVFGTWDGSFEVDPGASATPTSNVSVVTPAEASAILSQQPVYGSSKTTATPISTSTTSSNTTTPATSTLNGGTVLADKTVKTIAASPSSTQLQNTRKSAWKTYGIIGGLVVIYIIGDSIVSHRKRLHRIK